ncbi:MAG: hypothetical protein IJF67_13250 [Clostridia bacterium]|nr:hypothetical protein [Clostridia bacterium]
MKKAMFAIVLAAAMILCGCGEAAESYVNLASVEQGYYYTTDSEGNLYFIDGEAIYSVIDGELTLLAEASDILPYKGDASLERQSVHIAEWYEGCFYAFDSRDDTVWKYNPDTGTSEQLPVDFTRPKQEHFTGLGITADEILIFNDQLYLLHYQTLFVRYDMNTQETTPYYSGWETVLSAVDDNYMYFCRGREVTREAIDTGERLMLEMPPEFETENVFIFDLFLDGYGDIYYAVNTKTGEEQLWRGTTDNSAPCERVALPTALTSTWFDYNGWLYYRDTDTVWRLNMKNERIELFMPYDGHKPLLLGGKICNRAGEMYQFDILADLDALD